MGDDNTTQIRDPSGVVHTVEKEERRNVPHLRFWKEESEMWGCEVPMDSDVGVSEHTHSDDHVTVYFNRADDVSDMKDWDAADGVPYDAGAYVDNAEVVWK